MTFAEPDSKARKAPGMVIHEPGAYTRHTLNQPIPSA